MMTRKQVRDAVADFIRTNPQMPYKDIAHRLNVAPSTIGSISREYGIRRLRSAITEENLAELTKEGK